MTKERKGILIRMYIIYLLVLIFSIAIISKVVIVQSSYKKEKGNEPDSLNVEYRTLKASRGSIFSSDGKLLVTSVPVFEIRMDVASPNISDDLFFGKVDSLAESLANLFGDKNSFDYAALLRKAREEGNMYQLIQRNVGYDELLALRAFPILRRGKFNGGLIIIPKEKRVKPYRTLAFRTLGWDKEGGNLDVGLEGAYSSVLKGKDGIRLFHKLPNGLWKPVSDNNLLEPETGKDIITTLDLNIQDITENALLKQLKISKAHHGCAVVMEVETGDIKAIANLRIDSSDQKYKELYNYAVGESFEPGSTFKLVSMIAALEDKAINLDDSIDIGNGYYRYGNVEMHDASATASGLISYRKAFELSSNVGISKMIFSAYSGNPSRFIERLKKMRIDKQLGIEIKGEGRPYINNPNSDSWSGISLPWMAIGYEVRITPLQLLTFYNAVANDGKMMKPRFVESIMHYGESVEDIEPIVLKGKIASKKTIKQVQELLEGVVLRGTATNIKNDIYKIAGKTGTSKIAKGSEGYYSSQYYASFAGYFPADNPKYSCIVVINRPQGNYYGGHVAAPVFKTISDKVYALYLNIQHATGQNFSEFSFPKPGPGPKKDRLKMFNMLNINTVDSANTKWVSFSTGQDHLILNNLYIPEDEIPDLVGMTAMEAIFLLEKVGVKVKIKGKGRVTKQSVIPGTAVRNGQTVWLTLNPER